MAPARRTLSVLCVGAEDVPGRSAAGQKPAFSDLLYVLDLQGWVHDVAWHPSGRVLAAVSHACDVTLLSPFGHGKGCKGSERRGGGLSDRHCTSSVVSLPLPLPAPAQSTS